MELQTQLRFDIFGQAVLPDMLNSTLIDFHPESDLDAEMDREMEPDSGFLLEQTRQLFHHQGPDSELLDQILVAIDAIEDLCSESSVT